MARISITIPDDLKEQVDSRLDYADSRSQWITEAVRDRLRREEEIEA